MKMLFSFMMTTLDGYHVGPDGEFDWPNVDDEFHEYSLRQLRDIDALLFGRATYEHMAAWWPTAEAADLMPATARAVNRVPKVVFSSSLAEATWENARLVSTDPVAEIEALKREPGEGDLALLGSSALTASLLDAGVVDQLRVMVNPILLGGGVPVYDRLAGRVPLRLARTTTFRNGNVLLVHEPAGAATGS